VSSLCKSFHHFIAEYGINISTSISIKIINTRILTVSANGAGNGIIPATYQINQKVNASIRITINKWTIDGEKTGYRRIPTFVY